MTKNYKVVYKMVLIAVFSALAYVGTTINIPLPAGGKIHLGNFVCILSSLLCGGVVGGISGSLGMGLNDLVFYSSYPATIIRTFIIKLILGLTVGFLFRFILRRKYNSKFLLYGFSSLFLLVFCYSLFVFLFKEATIVINESKSIKLNIMLPISSAVFGMLLLFGAIFSHRLNKIQSTALFATSVGIIVNVVGEFLLRMPLVMIFEDLNITGAFVKSLSSLPSAILTGILTAILITLIFYPLLMATKNIKVLDLNLDEYNE